MSGGLSSGDLPTEISYELDLIADAGLCDWAITLPELIDALDQLHHHGPGSTGLELAAVENCGAVSWAAVDDAVAAREGWGLFDTGRDPIVEIQCIDAPDIGQAALEGDEGAWDAVFDGIVRGCPIHGRAFAVVVAHAPTHAAELLAHWARTTSQTSP